jgi:PAS domain S-box-containing protein
MSGQKQHDLLVLYAEDEAITREEISYFLKKRVRDLLITENGEKGLDLFRRMKPDLIITDVAMPVMDGLKMARAIRELDSGVPIILITAHSDASYMLDAIDLGIDQYVLKPVKTDKLALALDRCAAIINSHRADKYVRDITSALGEGVYVLNARGEVTFMNPEAESLFGWSEKELIHKNIHDIVHNRTPNGTPLLFNDCEMRKVIENGNRFHSQEEVFIRKDGTVFPVSVFSTPLKEKGRVVASVTAFRDISERKKIEQEREKMIIDLQKALSEIKKLQGILPICSVCKKIRDDAGAWSQMETYISNHTDALFSHGYCPECAKKAMEEVERVTARIADK